MKVDTEKKSEKLLYVELLRIIAIFCVIFNHTGNCGFFLFSERPAGSLSFWLYLCITVACRFAIPLFFAISGVLLLNRKEESIKAIWQKRISKIAWVLVVHSVLCYSASGNWNSAEFFRMLYGQGTAAHLWYLYAYITFLICLPFLRVLVQNLDDRHFHYLIGIALIIRTVLPIAEYFIWKDIQMVNYYIGGNWLVGDIVLYPCIGYYLHYRLDHQKIKKLLPYLWMLSVLGILISAFMTYYRGEITGVLNETESQDFLSIFALITCISVFLTVKYVVGTYGLPAFAAKLVKSMGSCVFGIYLLHSALRPMQEKTFMLLVDLGWNGMISSLTVCFSVLIVCYWMVQILKKIPLIKTIL